MISKELEMIIDKISTQGKMNFLEATKEEDIKSFEKEHNIKFPKKYKEWLLFSDGGECFLPSGVQFYGVAHKPIIDIEDNDRPDDSYIVIGILASGDTIIFKKTEEKICIYNHEDNQIEDDEIYEDFFAFLNDMYAMLGMELNEEINPMRKAIGYALASKCLVENNMKVRFMYREEPDDTSDSGWRFFSGDESDEYINNSENIGIYSIETISKIDPDIIPLLSNDTGTAFERESAKEPFHVSLVQYGKE